MIYRCFGRTGLRMPVLSCGLMRSMHSWKDMDPGQIPLESQHRLEGIVHRALESGITHLETARGYGSAERQLGRVLAGIDRDSYILQTKVRPEDDTELFTANVLDSLDRLQVERVDLLAIHGLNDYHSLWQVCRPGGCLAAARELQRRGRVGWVGFSGHGSTGVQLAAVRHEKDGGFDFINLHWYMILQAHSPVLRAARNRDMGVFIISPSDKGGMLHSPPSLLVRLSAPLHPMQFNDLLCLGRPEIHTISVGAARPTDFDLHLDGLARLDQLSLITDIAGRWHRAMEEATGQPRPDALWKKFPSWEETPGYINIPFILWLRNLARGWSLVDFARARYRKLGRDMPWVAGNNGSMCRSYDWRDIAAGAGWEVDDLVRALEEAHHLLGDSGELDASCS